MARGFTNTGVNTSYLRNDSFGSVITAYPFSMAAWGRSTSTTVQQCCVWVGDSAAATNFADLQFAGATGGDPVRATSFSTSAATSLSSTGFTANAWYHAGGLFTSSTSRTAYIDGVAGTANTTTRTFPTINSFAIGIRGDSTPANEFAGRLCEIGIWNGALTTSDFAALAAGVSPALVRPDILVVYCPLIRDAQELIGGRTPTAGATSITIEKHARVFYPSPSQFTPRTPIPIEYVNGSAANNTAGGTTLAAPAINATAGNFIAVAVSNYTSGGVAVSSVTDTATNTYARAGTSQGGDGSHTHDVWYAYNITGNATNVVTANFAASAAFRVIHALQYSGIATAADPYDTESTGLITASGTTHTSNNTATTTNANNLIFGSGVQWAGGATDFTGNDGTIRIEHGGGGSVSLDKIVSTTGAYSLAFDTDANDQYYFVVKTFKGIESAQPNTYDLAAETGSVTISGQTADLIHDKTVEAETGSVTITGQDVTFLSGYTVTAETGAVTISGQDAELGKISVLTAETGAVAITGQDVGLNLGLTLIAETGSVAIAGQDITFQRARTLTADTGAITITGQDAILTKGAEGVLDCNTGSIIISGQAADLNYSGAAAGGGNYARWRRTGRR